MIRAGKGIALLTALALAGCNFAPRYVRPEAPVPPQVAGGAAKPGEAIVPADTAWADFFTDPRLRAVVGQALANNRDLRIALANVEQARAQYRVQRADIFPTLGVNAGATYQKSPFGAVGAGGAGGGAGAVGGGRFDIYQASAGISAWEIDLFGRLRNMTTAAQERFFAAQENRNAAQTALVAEVATAWLTLAADRERLRIAQDTESTFGQTVALTEARFKAGIASGLETQQARTTYEQARSDVADAKTAAAKDLNALTLLVGATVPSELLPARLETGRATLDRLPGSLPSDVLLRRPDIAAAEHQLIAANADIGAARAAFFPRLSLTAAIGTLSLGLSNLFADGSETWSVAPSATLPIFDFGRNAGNLASAKASQQGLLATYEKTIQTAFREVADALAQQGTIDDQLAAQTSLRDNARGAFTLAEARFKAGIDPFLTTLVAQRTYYGAEQSLLAARLVREANAVELYRALGGGLK